jgi:hypothetical protein
MGEIPVDCEEKCIFFQVLPAKQMDINRAARIATCDGKEFPGSLNTICGRCTKQKINDAALEANARKLGLLLTVK